MPQDDFGNYVCVMTPGPAPDLSVSPEGELISRPVVSGHGVPSHTPVIPAQVYTNVDSGSQYTWYEGAWHLASTGSGAWSGTDEWLIAAVSGSLYQLSSAVRDGNGTVLSGTVLWPDGTAGVFTTLVIDPTFLAIDSYSVTYPFGGKTVTQPPVTRDANGGVIVSPALVVS